MSESSLLKWESPSLAKPEDDYKKGGSLVLTDAPTERLTRDVMNRILPPKRFKANGDDLVQHVSITPATKHDVVKLQRRLDEVLIEKHAAETGISPARSEIYGQLFDEIIRQVTIDCSARGILLVQIRDQFKSTISTYQSLYESAITWGMRKAMQIEQAKDTLMAENARLKEERILLRQRNKELAEKIVAIEKREEDFRAQREREHAEETAFLRRQASQLKAQLEQMLCTK